MAPALRGAAPGWGRAPGARLTGIGCSQWIGGGGAAEQVWAGLSARRERGVPGFPPLFPHVSPQFPGIDRPSRTGTVTRESPDPNTPSSSQLGSRRFRASGCHLPLPLAPSAPPQDALCVRLQNHLLQEASRPASPFPICAAPRAGAGGRDHETGRDNSYPPPAPRAAACAARVGSWAASAQSRWGALFAPFSNVPSHPSRRIGRARASKGASEARLWVPRFPP